METTRSSLSGMYYQDLFSCANLLSLRPSHNRDIPTPFWAIMKLDQTLRSCKKRMISAHANQFTSMNAGAALAHNDLSAVHTLSIKKLDPEPFTLTIAAILGGSTRFTCCHLLFLMCLECGNRAESHEITVMLKSSAIDTDLGFVLSNCGKTPSESQQLAPKQAQSLAIAHFDCSKNIKKLPRSPIPRGFCPLSPQILSYPHPRTA